MSAEPVDLGMRVNYREAAEARQRYAEELRLAFPVGCRVRLDVDGSPDQELVGHEGAVESTGFFLVTVRFDGVEVPRYVLRHQLTRLEGGA